MLKTLAILFFLLFPLFVFSQEDKGWTYTGDKSITEIAIPNDVGTIDYYAFKDCPNLKKVYIPPNITNIKGMMFKHCPVLEEISVDSENSFFTSIDGVLFSKDKSKIICCPPVKATDEYTIPESVTIIGYGAFFDCDKLTKLAVPNHIKEIQESAFEECSNIESVSIPSSVTTIRGCAFSTCYKLRKFEVDPNNQIFSTIDGVLFSYNKTRLISCPNLSEYTIPSSVKRIGGYSFQGCYNLKSVTIPNSVEIIEEGAFSYCDGLTLLTIPNSVKKIGESAFWACKNLKTVKLPNNLEQIAPRMFHNCSGLKSISIPKSVKEIGEYAFQGCGNLYEITIANGVEKIEDYAFSICENLKSVTIPSSVKAIGIGAFWRCKKLESIIIPGSVKTIAKYAFQECDNLKTLNLKNGVEKIDDYAFRGCNCLTKITFPESIEEIGERAFSGCTSLQSVTFGVGVSEIDDYAFESCNNLSDIIIPTGVRRIGEKAFPDYENRLLYDVDTTELLHVPQSVKMFSIPKSVVTIRDGAFSDCANLESITIPGSVKTVGNAAFLRCVNLKSVTIEDGVEEIGFQAFYGCTNLDSVFIPESVREIWEEDFAGCDNVFLFNADTTEYNGVIKNNYNIIKCAGLESVTISGNMKKIDDCKECENLRCLTIEYGVENIGFRAFAECSNLESVTIPGSVKKIGLGAFNRCGNLKSVIIENGVEEIDNSAFAFCSLESITIPGSVKKIGHQAFSSCENLKSVTIENGVKSIDNGAFEDCYNIESISIPESVQFKCNSNAFSDCKNLLLYNADSTILVRVPQSVKEFSIPESVVRISYRAFSGCSNLESITIPGSVKTIETYAFEKCGNLKNVTIGNGVEAILDKAFASCNNLENIVFPESIQKCIDAFEPYEQNYCFNSDTTVLLHVPRLFTKFVIPKSVVNITTGAFNGWQVELDSITIPGHIRIIGNRMFEDFVSLKSVSIENGVEKVGEEVFLNCDNLESVSIPGSVKNISDGTFNGCKKLKYVTIGNGVERIGVSAFSSCENLESITIPGSVKLIGNGAFKHCKKLKSVTIEDGVEHIEMGAFYDCPSLETVTIPVSVKVIEESVFSYPALVKSDIDTSSTTNLLVYKCLIDYYKYQDRFDLIHEYCQKAIDILKSAKLSGFNHFSVYKSIAEYYSTIGDFERMLHYSQEGFDLIMKKYENSFKAGVVDTLQNKDFIRYSSLLLLQSAEAYLNLHQDGKANEILLERFPFYNYLKGYDITYKIQSGIDMFDYHQRCDEYSWLYYWDLLFKRNFMQNKNPFYDDNSGVFLGLPPHENFGLFCSLTDDIILDIQKCYLYYRINNFPFTDNPLNYLDFESFKNEPTLFSIMGDFYYNRNAWTGAYTYYKKSFIYEFDKLKRNFTFMNSYQRSSYWQEHQLSFDNIVKICTRLSNNESICMAYNSLLVSKGLLLSSEQSLSSVIINSKDQKLIDDFYKLKQYRLQMDTDSAKREDLRILSELLENNLMQRSSQIADITNYMKVDWQMVKNSLGKKDCAIEFFFNDADSLFALVLKRDFDSPKLISLSDFSKIKDTYYSNTDVYNAVWKPLEQYFSTDGKVYFSPSWQLYNIAIEYAPIDEHRTISQKYKIYRISSTRLLALNNGKSKTTKTAAVFGGIKYNFGKGDWLDLKEFSDSITVAFRDVPIIEDSTLRSGVTFLPGSQLEYEAVSKILKEADYQLVDNTTGITATEELFKKLSGQGIGNMLISTHGFYQPKDTVVNSYEREDITLSQSGLLFAGANSALDPKKRKDIPEGVDDGILTAKEISRLDFKGLDLVVLSACQTGLGEVTSEGVFGLQRGFKKAGAHTIVMSLWKVDDNATKDLMTEFYKNLVNGKSKREAFISAQEFLRKKYQDPRKWAAFVMVDGVE
ncbi:MAG: leucine-rich repeat protein [Bacteroidales bacterium]|nr:leucine-rich repeat protein [Bacteroidales bacterium]